MAFVLGLAWIWLFWVRGWHIARCIDVFESNYFLKLVYPYALYIATVTLLCLVSAWNID